MMVSIFASVSAYISTNIDDIFVLTLLLVQASKVQKGRMIAGHCLGVAVLTFLAMLGALGLQNLPLKYVGILGFVPIALGIKALFDRKSDAKDAPTRAYVGLLSMAMITLGNGADNLGVYIPLFTGFSQWERICAMGIFAAMTALWIFLANVLASFPKVKTLTTKFSNILIPATWILLGIYILFDSGLFH